MLRRLFRFLSTILEGRNDSSESDDSDGDVYDAQYDYDGHEPTEPPPPIFLVSIAHSMRRTTTRIDEDGSVAF